MSNTTVRGVSFQTLPVELIYRILDYLDNVTILLSCRNVCTRLNDIVDGYHRYRVISNLSQRSNIISSFTSLDDDHTTSQ